MKMNQSEIQALSVRLYQNLEKQAEIAQDQLNAKQDRDNAKIVLEIAKELKVFDKAFKSLSKDAQNYITKEYGYRDYAFGKMATKVDPEAAIKRMRKEQTTVTMPERPVHWNRFKNDLFYDLTIAQIDSDNVDELLSKAARRYLKLPSDQPVPRVNDKP